MSVLIERNCKTCGKMFTTSKHRFEKYGYGMCCSKKCSWQYNGLRSRNGKDLTCSVCQQVFYRAANGIKPSKNYCSVACSDEGKKVGVVIKCSACSREFYRRRAFIKPGNMYCSHKCYSDTNTGENNARWKGGSYINENGYRRIRVNGKEPYEHRYLVEQSLNRKLSRWEDVHHIDGDKLNNDLGNLVVLSKRDHTKLHKTLKPQGVLGKTV